MDNQLHSASEFYNHVVQVCDESSMKSASDYAIGSFVDTFKEYGLTVVDAVSLKIWVASMYLRGNRVKTVERYVGKIHSLYTSFTGIRRGSENDPFVQVQSAIDSSYQINDDNVQYNVEKLKRLYGKNESSSEWQTIREFFYLLYNVEATLYDVVNVTFDNAPRYCAQIDEIVRSCDKSYGRKYLFALDQKQKRPSQILNRLSEDLTSMQESNGMRIGNGLVRDEITAMWICVALKMGIDIRDIRATVSSIPYQYRALLLIKKPELPENLRHAIICQVADAFNDNTSRWFVMKLRKGVHIDKVKDKIEKELPGRLGSMELFYPTRTVYCEKEGKKVKEERPYISDLLFFQTQYNKIRSLFAKIGDLAYCLKDSNLPDSHYSVISYEEMSNFQKCIGQFTPDIRIELVDANRGLCKGRFVRIIGGMMRGYQGKIEDIDESKGIRMFSLQITNEKALNWIAEVEDIFIEPIEK